MRVRQIVKAGRQEYMYAQDFRNTSWEFIKWMNCSIIESTLQTRVRFLYIASVRGAQHTIAIQRSDWLAITRIRPMQDSSSWRHLRVNRLQHDCVGHIWIKSYIVRRATIGGIKYFKSEQNPCNTSREMTSWTCTCLKFLCDILTSRGERSIYKRLLRSVRVHSRDRQTFIHKIGCYFITKQNIWKRLKVFDWEELCRRHIKILFT